METQQQQVHEPNIEEIEVVEETEQVEKDWSSSYLLRATVRDRVLHAPFEFLSKNIFVTTGTGIGYLFSFVLSYPQLLLILIGGGIGFAVQFMLKPSIVQPPYFLTQQHAAQYGRYYEWEYEVQEENHYQAEAAQAYQQMIAEQQGQQGHEGVIDKAENMYEKSNQVFDAVDGISSILEDPMALFDGAASGVFDLLRPQRNEEGEVVESTTMQQHQANNPYYSPLPIALRQQMYNEAIEKLDGMQGLNEPKRIVTEILNTLRAIPQYEAQGMEFERPTMHMIYSGPAGTGKTETARIMAKILQATGYLATGQLIEVSRSDLVAEYQGQTAKNVQAKFDEAMGGILFIDEAYALKNGDNDQFGQEAIDTIIPLMENRRKDMIVILAGYESDMEKLMKANSGFKSRIAYTVRFDDYTVDELLELTLLMLSKRGFTVSPTYKPLILKTIKGKAVNGVVDGNARWVRNYVDKIVNAHNTMIANGEVTDVRVIQSDAFKLAEQQILK